MVLHDRCWTSNRLRRHGLRDRDDYALCAQEVEIIDHLLIGFCLRVGNLDPNPLDLWAFRNFLWRTYVGLSPKFIIRTLKRRTCSLYDTPVRWRTHFQRAIPPEIRTRYSGFGVWHSGIQANRAIFPPQGFHELMPQDEGSFSCSWLSARKRVPKAQCKGFDSMALIVE